MWVRDVLEALRSVASIRGIDNQLKVLILNSIAAA